MVHAVILFDERDADVAERLDTALESMKRKGLIATHSILNILPGQDIAKTIENQSLQSEVSIVILSIDTNQDLICNLVKKHKDGSTNLLIVYANYVDEDLIREFNENKIPVVPLMPIASHPNKDAAYQKVVRKVKTHLQQAAKAKTLTNTNQKKNLLIMLAARRNTLNSDE